MKYVSLSRLTFAFGNVSLERPTYKKGTYFETVPSFALDSESRIVRYLGYGLLKSSVNASQGIWLPKFGRNRDRFEGSELL